MSPLTYEHRWTGFEPITTASPTNKLQLKPRSGFVFLSALPDWATTGDWKCRIRTAPLRPRRSVLLFTPHSHQQPQRESNPCFRSDSPAYSPLYYEAMFYGRLLRLRFGGSAAPANKKAACLIGQAAVSAIHTGICLVIPRLALKLPVPNIHLIRSY